MPKKKRRRNPGYGSFDSFDNSFGSGGVTLEEFLRMLFYGESPFVDNKQPEPSPDIPKDLMRKMIFLCHPDKHADHPWATEVTQWLLKHRV